MKYSIDNMIFFQNSIVHLFAAPKRKTMLGRKTLPGARWFPRPPPVPTYQFHAQPANVILTTLFFLHLNFD